MATFRMVSITEFPACESEFSKKTYQGYKYYVEEVTSLINKKKFSTLHINFLMKRNESYYSLTLFIPILVMTLLSPCGLILPVDAGEKMGLQITVLLTMVIYVEVLQNNIPVFDSYGNTPLMLIYFIVTIVTICVCLLVSTHTLFLYHVNSYEAGCPDFQKALSLIFHGHPNVSQSTFPKLKRE